MIMFTYGLALTDANRNLLCTLEGLTMQNVFPPADCTSILCNVNVELRYERMIIAKTDNPTAGTIMDLGDFTAIMIFSR